MAAEKKRGGASLRLFVTLFAPLLTVVVASGVVFAVVSGRIMTRYVQSEAFQTLEKLNAEVSAYFAPAALCVESFAQAMQRTDDRAVLDMTLATLADGLEFSNGLYYGTRISRYREGGLYLDSTGWDPPATWEPAARPWFQGADAAGGALYFEEPYVDAQTHELCVTVAKAVPGADGRAVGVVGVDLLIDELAEMVRTTSVSGHGEIHLLTEDGTYLTNAEPGKVMAANYFAESAVPAGAAAHLDGSRKAFIAHGRYYAAQKIGETPWFIVAEGPVSDFNATLVRTIIVFEAVLFALCLAFAFLNIRTVSKLRAGDQKTGALIFAETQNLAVSVRENAATSQEQSAAVKEIVATMEDNTRLSEHISGKIRDVSAVAGKTNGDVSGGVELLAANVRQLHEIADANVQTIDGIKELGAKIGNIWDIVTLINSVADQAKIIAFNAELEASSAGEAGKNFHIVATEIRRLADGIIDGTKEIKDSIAEIQQSSDSLILASEGGTERISAGVAGAQELSERFESIKNASEATARSAGDITTIIQQQAQASEQILVTLRQIAGGAESFTQATEQISGAAEKLTAIARGLTGTLAE